MPTFPFTCCHQFWLQDNNAITLQNQLPKTPKISSQSGKGRIEAATTHEAFLILHPCSLVQLWLFWAWCWYWLPTHGGSSCGVWHGFQREGYSCGDQSDSTKFQSCIEHWTNQWEIFMLIGSFSWGCQGVGFWTLLQVFYHWEMLARANYGWWFEAERTKRACGVEDWDFWTRREGKNYCTTQTIGVSSSYLLTFTMHKDIIN